MLCPVGKKKKRNHSFQGQTSANCDCFVHVNKITFCFDSISGSHLQCVYCTYHSNDDLPVSTICLKLIQRLLGLNCFFCSFYFLNQCDFKQEFYINVLFTLSNPLSLWVLTRIYNVIPSHTKPHCD